MSGMIPVCSELGLLEQIGKSPRRVGALPAAWENVFAELKGVISLAFFSFSLWAAQLLRLQAADWDPRREVHAAPGLAHRVSTWSREMVLAKRWQPSFRMTKWARHCAGEGIREDFLEEAAPEGQVKIN